MNRILPLEIGSVYNETTVRQRTSDGYFCATDLLAAYEKATGIKKNMGKFVALESTKSFSGVIQKRASDESKAKHPFSGSFQSAIGEPIQQKRGVKGGTWMHPYMFLDFAMWLSPEFKYNVMKWIYDKLIDLRHQAGDNYLVMCSVIQQRYIDYYGEKPSHDIFQREAKYLNTLVFGDERGRQRNDASEGQLTLLSNIQKLNAQLIKSGEGLESRRLKLAEYVNMNRLLSA